MRIIRFVCLTENVIQRMFYGEMRVFTSSFSRLHSLFGLFLLHINAHECPEPKPMFHDFFFFSSSSPGCPGAGCLLDIQTGGRTNADGDGDRQRRRGHARHPGGRCRVFFVIIICFLAPSLTSAPWSSNPLLCGVPG